MSQSKIDAKTRYKLEWKARILVVVIGFFAYYLLALVLSPLFKGEFLNLDEFVWVIGFWLYVSYCIAYLYMSFKCRDLGESILSQTLKHVALAPLYATPFAIIMFFFVVSVFGDR